ncbi:MAG: Eco57I restriction-modification methylase domain-containing protein [Methanobrevibacter sp.]|jgi:23S rRNA G2445 N2-methylase RlmL|nr:Eco57I restriction-modification methylase domain-containing protein [Candidatus Methanovirga basalitermitum]
MSKDTNYEKIANEIRKAFHFEPNQKFDYCISNPPYQSHITGKRAQPIYPIFFLIQTILGKNVCNIFPLA